MLNFEFSLSSFDLGLIPIDADLLRSDPNLLRSAVVENLASHFKRLGGKTDIIVNGDTVVVTWIPDSLDDAEKLSDYAVSLLQRGSYSQAEPILRALLKHDQWKAQAAFNLGMMLSDQRRLDEAIVFLKQAVASSPSSANAWNALGVAYQRQQNDQLAVEALRKSYELDPENAYTLRNLGALLANSFPVAGLDYLRRAAELLPEDQAAVAGYGKALAKTGETDEADNVLRRAIEIAPFTAIAEESRRERTAIAHTTMRDRGGQVRMDVVMYIAGALNLFEKLDQRAITSVTSEIALKGRSGLDINDPSQKYSLKTLPGQFSGLHLVAIMYAGLQRIAPQMDPSIDFSREYAEALNFKQLGL